MMQRPDVAGDARFATAEGRRKKWRALRQVLGEWLDGFVSVEAALEVLEAARVPCAPVLHPAEVIASPHLAERSFFPPIPHPGRGSVRAQCVRCHLSWAFPLEDAPYPTEWSGEEKPAEPISADEVIELHRLLRDFEGPLADLVRGTG